MTRLTLTRTRRLACAGAIAVLAAFQSSRAADAPEPERPVVPVVVGKNATAVERLAARELAEGMQKLNPYLHYVVGDTLPPRGQALLVGSLATDPQLGQYLPRITRAPPVAGGPADPQPAPPAQDAKPVELKQPDSYAIAKTARKEGGELTAIVGADPRGTLYGVYGYLDRLGCGLYLSGDTYQHVYTGFGSSQDTWLNAPLVKDRIVFNWHNFLSGCSTWDLEHWNHWTAQSQKMGFNAIMVHAYGNNPIYTFEFGGQTKPVGHLSTTAKGRDWSTQHCNDVRRLWGGFVFDGPVFGSAAALVPDDQRVAAAQRMMHDAFAHAQSRAMDVYFAVDVDTLSANPQELITTLPPTARFSVDVPPLAWMNQPAGKLWLADPDTPEGYRYYKAQVDALLKAYPQVTHAVVWFRAGGTPWMQLKPPQFPAAWLKQYQAELARTPEAGSYWLAPGLFGIGKIVAAWQRAARESGRKVEIAAGSWKFDFLPAADRFFPPGVKLIALDYEVLHDRSQLADAARRAAIRKVTANRPVVPVVWAHHDDGHYVGRPYQPLDNFREKLADAGATGYGIIHWTTRPLDLYFANLAKQVWRHTQDQPLKTTCQEMADRSFGGWVWSGGQQHLEQFALHAPRFGRETSDYFIDRPLTDVDAVIDGCEKRLALFDDANLPEWNSPQRKQIEYYRGLERFMAEFHRAHDGLQRSQAALKAGDLPAARQALADCRPAEVIEQFARNARNAGITRGEQGLVVSLNLRWLTHFVRHRQVLGAGPIRYCFGPTSHDPLAQSRGTFTFHFDAQRCVWQRLGGEETGAAVFVLPPDVQPACDPALPGNLTPEVCAEICRSGIETDKPLTIDLGPIMSHDGRGKPKASELPPGQYTVRLLLLEPTAIAAGQRAFSVSLAALPAASAKPQAEPAPPPAAPPPLHKDRIDIFAAAGGANRVLVKTYAVKLAAAGSVQLNVTPEVGKAVLCGVAIEPE